MVRIEKVKQTRIEVPATPLLAECAQIMNITYDHDDDHNDDEETLKFLTSQSLNSRYSFTKEKDSRWADNNAIA